MNGQTIADAVPFETSRALELRDAFIPFDQVTPNLETSYLVQGWLGAGGLSVLYGPSNTGKTFVAVDLALHVASGTAWRDKKVCGGAVVYVAAEGGAGIRNRFAALKMAKPSLAAEVKLDLLPTHLDLHGSEDATALCAALPVSKCALIVIDTMARSMGEGDENSAKDLGQFILNCDIIRERTGAHVLIVHHSGKNAAAGARGSSALRAAVDTEIEISEGQIACTKQRDMEIPNKLYFSLNSIELGRDQDGDVVTSAVVVEASSKAPTSKKKRVSGQAEVALQALREVIKLSGKRQTGSNFPDNVPCVKIREWSNMCKRMGLSNGDSAGAFGVAFGRAKDKLVEADVIRLFDDIVWCVYSD